jgi:pimeloyl-ACP methyl ester carboxylesterase
MEKPTGNDITIKANGISINFDDLGTHGTPIIFIHGFPFDKSMWNPQMDFLKSTRRVIAYDIRGYGKSTPGNEDASISLYADDLIQFMNMLQINKAIVCGLSMGGYILLNAINRYPQRFSSIILCDTQCISDNPASKEKRYKTIELIEGGGIKEFTDGFIKNIFFEGTLNNKKDIVNKIESTVLSTSTESIISTLRALANRDDSCSTLSQISVPTLIICGKEDKITPVAQSEFLNKNIPNSKLNIIPDAGHLSNLEQPEEFNKILSAFLN